jgi:hypothetical protein
MEVDGGGTKHALSEQRRARSVSKGSRGSSSTVLREQDKIAVVRSGRHRMTQRTGHEDFSAKSVGFAIASGARKLDNSTIGKVPQHGSDPPIRRIIDRLDRRRRQESNIGTARSMLAIIREF